MNEPLYTTHDVAKLLSMDPSTISKWVDKGMLDAYRTPGGHRRITGTAIVQLCEKYRMPVPPELQPTHGVPPKIKKANGRKP